MPGLRKWFGNSKSGGTITRKEGLALLRCPFKTVPIRHVLSSKFNKHAFIYSFLSWSKMRCPILTKCISSLFNGRSFSIKVNLKWSLSRDSLFKIQFYLEWWRNWGSDQSFHVLPFSKDRTSINSNYETWSKVTCMTIPKWLYKMQYLQSQKLCAFRDYY